MAYPPHSHVSFISCAISSCLLEITWLLGDLAMDMAIDRHSWSTYLPKHTLVYDGALAESEDCYMIS